MVICGGLEILAAGYLLNEFNKDKVEARERRKRRDTGEGRPHNHSQPPPIEGRPYHNPQHVEPSRPSNFLQPPPQAPPRPISAPPIDPRPGAGWQNNHQPQPVQQSYGPQQIRPQQPSNPYLQHLQNDQIQQHPAPWQQPMMGAMQPGPHPPFNSPPPGPGHLQHANSFHPGGPPPNFQQGPPPPGPGHLQRPNTFQVPQNMNPSISQPNLQASNSFPIQSQQQQAGKPAPAGPLFYVDTKTGRISHNMYPADHPMARGPGATNGSMDLSKDLWGDDKYKRTAAGDINTGMVWSERDESDLAYGKDYSNGSGRRRRSASYERTRRRTDSDPLRY